jgi:hypothetical protein
MIKQLRAARRGRVAVTASTGIAGVNVGGGTIHSFAGMHLLHSSLLVQTMTYAKALVSGRRAVKCSQKKC